MVAGIRGLRGGGRHGWCLAAVLGLAALGGEGCTNRADGPGAGAPAVARVGGEPISAGLYRYYVKARARVSPEQLDTAQQRLRLEELAGLVASTRDVEPTVSPDARYEIELARLEILSRIAAQRAGVDGLPSEAEIERAYAEFAQQAGTREYRVAHILVATEAQATALLAQLLHGESFATIAARESADDSRSRGGDLGWIRGGHLPPALIDAVAGLRPGALAPAPVHTPYGWHVLKLLESRPGAVPPLDAVRAQIVENLRAARYRAFLEERRRSAHTEFYGQQAPRDNREALSAAAR